MKTKFNMMFTKKIIVATASKIKSGYSAGRHDGSASGQWAKV
jgi:hypothetical protein